jgi:hypothetical protein
MQAQQQHRQQKSCAFKFAHDFFNDPFFNSEYTAQNVLDDNLSTVDQTIAST